MSTICNGLFCMQFEVGIHNKVQVSPKAGYKCVEFWIFMANHIVAREKQNLHKDGIILVVDILL